MMRIFSKIKKISFLLMHPNATRQLFNSYFTGYLYQTGWTESAIQRKPVNKDGDPIPWISLPALELLDNCDLTNLSIFEYGSGNSTIWFSSRTQSVTSVEHDQEWYKYLKKKYKFPNTKILLIKLEYGKDYSKAINEYNNIDIVLIDGRDRVNCAYNAVNSMSPKGIVIFDDTQREQYRLGCDFLKNMGFKELKLVGMNVGRPMKKTTSIFYKPNNVLGI